MQSWLGYWTKETAIRNTDDSDGVVRLEHSASEQYGKLTKGDRLYIATIIDGRLFLLGAFTIKRLGDQKVADAFFAPHQAWQASVHAFAVPATASVLHLRDISDIAKTIRFDAKKQTIAMHGDVVAQQALRTIRALTAASAALLESRLESVPSGDRVSTPDAKNDEAVYERVLRRKRAAQVEFRKNVLLAYGNKCAISGFTTQQALEAAHIRPHSEDGDNRTANGLPLRQDLHALFDSGLIRIRPDTLEIVVEDIALDYREYNGKRIEIPPQLIEATKEALAERWCSNDSTAR